MELFRSEEHIQRWLDSRGFPRGTTVGIDTVLRLARAWYADPRAAAWRPRTRDESQAVLASVGLSGDFWELP
ncbi:MAG TPA: hypothetical protein VH277_04180 [Gemmatimonadaceae bacterium]|jgi:hypothetical protein|nr:hypothetical protein [Gemmatimonadaceae bacterium]